MTLELSYPEFKDRPTKAPHHSRGGYYKNWLDQYSDSQATQATKYGPDQDNQSENENDNDNDNDNANENEKDGGQVVEPEAEGDDEDMPHIDPLLRANSQPVSDAALRRKRAKAGKQKVVLEEEEEEEEEQQEVASTEMEDIQILELHSHNPIISYRGRVFEGQWAEVIGTEVVLANREEGNENPLPALRNLPGDVDLLGACCSRLLTTEKVLKPRVAEEDELSRIRKEWNIKIPPGKDRTGERAHQIRFLERLMALKKKKGQTDDVTVYALDGAGKDFNDKKGPDFKPRKRRSAVGAGVLGDSSGQASKMRERAQARRRVAGQNPRARRAGRGALVAGSSPGHGSSVLSTPTPSHWDDLSTREDEEAEREEGENLDEDDDGDGDGDEESDGDGENYNDGDSDEQEGTVDGMDDDGNEGDYDEDADEDVTMEG